MKILIFPDAEAAARETARRIVAQLVAKPDAVLGLATGGTMEPVYAALAAAVARGDCDGRRFTSFNLDEYVGLAGDHPQSYRHYMNRHLFDAIGLPAAQARLPRGDAPDPAEEARRYEAEIAAEGGIDLQLLGIGANGHIGFNEPTSSLASRTRIKTLTRGTVEANRRFFGPDEQVPSLAITIGIGTILESREALLLATGGAKAEAVAAMVEGPLSAACPASALQMHPRATVICDEEAAARLQLRDYYETVHPGGTEPAITAPKGLERTRT
ncbi:glucosamine-6-phosphate deaminase [Alloyangia pacifica]|uniref:glucosamine-6-phosphate deaminase n=1 Tax=Alloyangia pacifica TaxID=311180 RepID=UPI001CD40537|nr:glucosamine-6-phosphate deaminase [Alloyangia pacifica]MCA0997113.1 glucosamine-6-phosphate deaminase [Alloyangia pacifica]